MGFKKTIKGIWPKIKTFVVNLWSDMDKMAEKLCPVAINVVNGIKTVNSSSGGDVIEIILSKLIPGTADDAVIKLVRIWLTKNLPLIATDLKIIDSISKTKDVNEQLKAICNAINLSSDSTKNAIYHTLSSKILEVLSDGKITWGEAVMLSQYYYDNKDKL